MTSDQLAQGIIRHASRFVGLREVKPNANWDNPSTPGPDRALVDELRSLMRQSPWEEGWAYCAAFAEGMVLAALRSLAATPTQITPATSRQAVATIVMRECSVSCGQRRERRCS